MSSSALYVAVAQSEQQENGHGSAQAAAAAEAKSQPLLPADWGSWGEWASKPHALLALAALLVLLSFGLGLAVGSSGSREAAAPVALTDASPPAAAAVAAAPPSSHSPIPLSSPSPLSLLHLPVCPPATFLPIRAQPFNRSHVPAGCPAPPAARPDRRKLPSSSPRIAPVHTFIISFPRSGSSMTRKILEDGTGITTGSVYPDQGKSNVGVDGSRTTSRVLIVKGHFLREGQGARVDVGSIQTDSWRSGRYVIDRYIYVLRNPFDSLVSFYQYHQNHGDHSATVTVNLRRFKAFLFHWLPVWAEHVRYFTVTFPRGNCAHCDVLVLQYEDFVSPSEELTDPASRPAGRMICFLGYPVDRGCRPAGSEHGNASWTYAEKERKSLLNPQVSLPRTVSYSNEIFDSILTVPDIVRLYRVAGVEMRAFGYWPKLPVSIETALL